MRVALTGATGFTGGPILSALLRDLHEVTALVRNPAQSRLHDGIKIVQGDLHNSAALEHLCHKVDVLVHLAGAISAPNTAEYFYVNKLGTENVMRAARNAGIRRIVYISSLAARSPEISDYAASKHAGEQAAVAGTAGECLILRPSAVYGPGDKATLPLLQQLSNRIAVVPGSPGARFSLIEVSDLANIVAEAVTSSITGIRELDDTQGSHTWSSLANTMRNLRGTPKSMFFVPKTVAMMIGHVSVWVTKLSSGNSMLTPGKVRELYAPDWAVEGPGWPRANPVFLRDGLRTTMEWYVNAGWVKPVSGKAE